MKHNKYLNKSRNKSPNFHPRGGVGGGRMQKKVKK
jgi:hypothetical protein